MKLIYHITNHSFLNDALNNGIYVHPTLDIEGFIHCCAGKQVQGVLERYFKQKSNLIVLILDESKISSEVKNELSPSLNENFAHIYGSINLDAIVDIIYLN